MQPTPPPTPSPTVTTSPTPVNYTAPLEPAGPVGPNPPAPPVPHLFSTMEECCTALFYGPCSYVNYCPTPAPTPPIGISYDIHCTNGDVTLGCEPVAVISAEKLRDYTEGAAETQRIANALKGHAGMDEYVIDQEAWQCIWDELIPGGRGNRKVEDRGGYVESDYNFSVEMLQEMVNEYDRLIGKYTSSYWSTKPTANRLVTLLMESRQLVETERLEVASGARRLTDRDFLGPKEREQRRILKAVEEGRNPNDGVATVEEKKKHFEYFMVLEEKVKTNQRMEEAEKREEERMLGARKREEERMLAAKKPKHD